MTTDPLREGLNRIAALCRAREFLFPGDADIAAINGVAEKALAETTPVVEEIRLTKAVCTDPACTIKTKPGRPKHGPHDFRAATPPAPVAGAEVTDAMVERAYEAYWAYATREIGARDRIRAALTAALTPEES